VNVTRAIARFLEREKRWSFGLSLDPVRELDLPRGVSVIGVGGSTLGGSFRTPVAIALARALGDVALVSHGAGARVTRARIVEHDDDVREVGDEALIAVRALDAKVIVAPSRREAIAFAARHARTIVVDRLLQTRPVRLSRSILAVDARAPFGAGVTLPFGDLVAPRERLIAACDEIVAIGQQDEVLTLDPRARGLRVGAIASLARPDRMRRALQSLGVDPIVFVERNDHAPVNDRERRALEGLATRHRLDGWVVDAKTAVLGWEGFLLAHRVILPLGVAERVVTQAC
jgi:tetraacyldisaccharide-1-P 4'-kinase